MTSRNCKPSWQKVWLFVVWPLNAVYQLAKVVPLVADWSAFRVEFDEMEAVAEVAPVALGSEANDVTPLVEVLEPQPRVSAMSDAAMNKKKGFMTLPFGSKKQF